MAAGVRCVEIIPYNTIKSQVFWKMFFGAWPRACAPWQRARGQLVASSAGGVAVAAVPAGISSAGGREVLTRTGEGVRRCRCAGGRAWCGEGLRAWAWARVVLGCGCAVCGILRVWACGRVVFSCAVGGAWCSLRGDGVASVVVVVWCRLVYPPNKTCNAKTSYKYAILVLACKSPCGA